MAFQINPFSFEATQIQGSLRISQNRHPEAQTLLQHSITLITDQTELESLISLSKLLLEVSLYNESLTVLGLAGEIYDQGWELWYLKGLTCYLYGENENRDELWEESYQYLQKSISVILFIYF